MIKLRILGEPVAKARAKVTRWGAYTPEKTVNYETLIQEIYMQEEREKLNGELEMQVIAYFSIPKNTSKKKLEEMLKGTIRPTKKPDLDNIIKIVGDALNKIAYDDDSQIVRVSAEKWYSDTPRVEIIVRGLK